MGQCRHHQYRYRDVCSDLTVGNEAVFGGKMSASDMVTFIGAAKGQLRAAGFTGIISTVETVGTYQTYPELCACIETTIHANIHAYFNAGTPSSQAGSFVVSQRSLLANVCGKSVIISETGWPSGGPSNGAAIASPSDQSTAISSIEAVTGNGEVTYFSYCNDAWKPAGVEQNFGILSILLQHADFYRMW
jgi:exo-beta-1,3-glucanase (GH17 family)